MASSTPAVATALPCLLEYFESYVLRPSSHDNIDRRVLFFLEPEWLRLPQLLVGVPARNGSSSLPNRN